MPSRLLGCAERRCRYGGSTRRISPEAPQPSNQRAVRSPLRLHSAGSGATEYSDTTRRTAKVLGRGAGCLRRPAATVAVHDNVRRRYPTLKRPLSIFRALIFDSSVDDGTPSRVAAPNGPDTRPLLSLSAASMTSFS